MLHLKQSECSRLFPNPTGPFSYIYFETETPRTTWKWVAIGWLGIGLVVVYCVLRAMIPRSRPWLTKRALRTKNLALFFFFFAIHSIGSECERNSRYRINSKEFSRITWIQHFYHALKLLLERAPMNMFFRFKLRKRFYQYPGRHWMKSRECYKPFLLKIFYLTSDHLIIGWLVCKKHGK